MNVEKNAAIKADIRKFYRFGKTIGQGKFSSVRLATKIEPKQQGQLSSSLDDSNQSQRFAIKSLLKANIKNQLRSIKQQLEVFSQLDHPNIIKFHEIYEDDVMVYFVMEYCDGGELFNRLLNKKILTEQQASVIMFKLFSACAYLHSKNIIHNDIRSEKILLTKSGEIKLIDFGMSKQLSDENMIDSIDLSKSILRTHITPFYAPEVIMQCPATESDNWALGVLLYQLLSGSLPFYSEDQKEIINNIRFSSFSFSDSVWKKVSKEAKTLITKLLQKSPQKRLTSSMALQEKWITQYNKVLLIHLSEQLDIDKSNEYTPINEKQINSLKNYATSNKMKKEALRVFVKNMDEDDIMKLKAKFNEADKDHNGVVTLDELQQLMGKLGMQETSNEISKIIENIHINNTINGKPQLYLNFTEFVAAILDQKFYLNKETLWDLFKTYDIHNKNYLEQNDLDLAFQKQGRSIPKLKLIHLFNEMDIDGDGRVDFADFCRVMLPKMKEKEFQKYYQKNLD